VKLPAPPAKDRPFDVVTFGYNSVDFLCLLPRYPAEGEKIQMASFDMQGGGQAATAAAALARWGFKTRYLGKFGEGREGLLSRQSLVSEGVDVSGSIVAEGMPNQTAVILVDQRTGERTIVYTREKGLAVEPGEIPAKLAASGRVLLTDAHQIPATVEAALAAKDAGIPVVIDAEKILPDTADLIVLGDYVLCDSSFPRNFTGIDKPEDALAALGKRGAFVAMTLGAEGSLAYFDGEIIRTPGIKVECVDTTGAGDVFHAGFVAGLLLGMDAEQTLRFANAAAGLKCRALGGRKGIPARDEILTAMVGMRPS